MELVSEENIKLCPFCGGKAELAASIELATSNTREEVRVIVSCTGCKANIPALITIGDQDYIDGAIGLIVWKWNKRAHESFEDRCKAGKRSDED